MAGLTSQEGLWLWRLQVVGRSAAIENKVIRLGAGVSDCSPTRQVVRI